MMKDDGGSAFPVPDNVAWDKTNNTAVAGMTLRDYFAAKAMQGMAVELINKEMSPSDFAKLATELMPEISYMLADAMLKEREK